MAEVAFVVADGFEDSELLVPRERIAAAGHHVTIVGLHAGETIRGKHGAVVAAERAAPEVDAASVDAIVIPGGFSPDRLRIHPPVVDLVRQVAGAHKLVAAICHGPSLLIEADLVRGRTVTSWPSIRTDLRNAGATWVDRPVVEDANLVTSRHPGDLDEFTDAVLRHLASRGP